MKQPYILIISIALAALMLGAVALGYIIHFLLLMIIMIICFITIILPSSHKFPKILSIISFFIKNSCVIELIDMDGYSTYTIAYKVPTDISYMFAYVYWATHRGPIYLEIDTNKIIESASVDYIKWWFPYNKEGKIAALLINDFPDFEKLRDKHKKYAIMR